MLKAFYYEWVRLNSLVIEAKSRLKSTWILYKSIESGAAMTMKRKSPKIEAQVVEAIRRLQAVQGSTPQEISNYIAQEYNIPNSEIKPHVQLALKRGVTYGILQRMKGYVPKEDKKRKPLSQTNCFDKVGTNEKLKKRLWNWIELNLKKIFETLRMSVGIRIRKILYSYFGNGNYWRKITSCSRFQRCQFRNFCSIFSC